MIAVPDNSSHPFHPTAPSAHTRHPLAAIRYPLSSGHWQPPASLQSEIPAPPPADASASPRLCGESERLRNEPIDPAAPNPQPPVAPELADPTPAPAHSPLRNEPIARSEISSRGR